MTVETVNFELGRHVKESFVSYDLCIKAIMNSLKCKTVA